MKRTITAFVLAASALLVPVALRATHLVGGNLGYVYLGETFPGSQVYRYQVTMEFYMNCGANSNFQTFQDLLDQSPNGTLPVGVYLQDPQDPNADKDQQAVVELALVDEEQIIPEFPANCSVGQGLCTLRGLFSGTVDLPLSFAGYHLYFQMCCRNLDIDNLNNPNNTGIGYYAFIPPTLVENSSPVFLGIPTPLLCINDTTSFINSASDPDGDQLIFSFETPYNSISQQGGVQPPPNQLPWPVPEVTYAAGYNTALPFGVGGYSFINGATGLTEYQPIAQGNYVIAVEVKEFRNGQLIGRTRRDLQLQAVACPANQTPQTNGPITTAYSVNAGDQLCFPMDFIDLDNDSVTLTASGTIFDPALFNPPAVLQSPVSGAGTVSAQFCWTTGCDQGQDQPYLFSVSVLDNGCPPKSVDLVFQLTVVPFTGPQVINGPLSACTQATGVTYSTPPIAGATFAWTVNGGTITGGQGSASITVDWGAAGAGSVLVSATNAQGCSSAPVSISVNIAALPLASAGADRIICAGDTTVLGGSPTGPNGSGYLWSPAAGLDATTAANPAATPTATTDYVVQVTNAGCIGLDTVRVTVSAPTVEAGADTGVCLGDSVKLSAIGTGTFSWSPVTGVNDPNIPDPRVSPTTTTTYTVTLTDANGCTAVDSVLVQVYTFDQAIAITPATTSGCEGDTAVFSATPDGTGNSYNWSATGGLAIQGVSGNTVTVEWTVPGPGTLTVVVTDTNFCTASFDAPFTTLELPPVDAGPDTTICAGQSVQLNGSGSGSLVWSPIAGLSDPNIPDPIANPESTQVYTLTVTGGNLCTNSDQTTVTVNVLPNANAGPDLAVCAGDTVQLQASGPGTYSWSPASSLSDPNATNPLAFPATTTTYTLTLTDSLTCSSSDEVTVTVGLPSNAGTDGDELLCGAGLPIFLISQLGGNPDPNGSWTAPGNIASNGLFTPGVSTPGVYLYVVPGGPGCGSDTAAVTITELPSPDPGQDAFIQLCSNGAPVDLFTVLGGTPDPGGSWTDVNGFPYAGIFDPTTEAGNSFIYRVTGTPPCSDAQATVTVSVNPAPDPGADASITVCSSSAAFVMTAALGGTPAAGGVWQDPNGAPHPVVFDPAVDPPGDWTYLVAGGFGCADTTATLSITVTVPDAAIAGDNAICAGDTTQLTATGANVAWNWSPANSLNNPTVQAPLFFPGTTTTYSVLVTDASGCTATGQVTVTVSAVPVVDAGPNEQVCAGGTVQIGGSPTSPTGTAYQWSPAAGLDQPGDPNPDATPAATTTYTVIVTDAGGCSARDSATVTVVPLPQLEAGPDTGFCQGGGVQLNASGAGNFLWSPATGLSDPTNSAPVAQPQVTTTYTVTLTANGCTSTDQLTVTVLGVPNADAGPDRYLCPGFDVQLQGSGGGTALWSPAGSLSDPASPTPLASPLTTTTYTLTITDGNGCTDTDDMNVEVSTDPAIDAGPDVSICAGEQVTIGGNPTSIPGTTVVWTPAAGLNDPTAANPVASPTATTAYIVTVTSDTCTAQDIVLVTLQGSSEVAFRVRLEPACDGMRAFFTDLSTGAAAWSWDFGDGATSTEQNPQHYFAYGQAITVTLTVTDALGCTGSLSQTYPIAAFSELVDYDMPNVFTPNGDGVNDVFTLNSGLNSNAVLGPCASMQVFNRWGQKVFTSQGNNLLWDGRNFAGEPCTVGTYFWTLSVKDLNFNGDVYLNR